MVNDKQYHKQNHVYIYADKWFRQIKLSHFTKRQPGKDTYKQNIQYENNQEEWQRYVTQE